MTKTQVYDKKIKSKILNSIGKMHKSGCIEKAIEMCHGELINNPNNGEIHIILGDLYLEKHLDVCEAKIYIDEAINEYQQALETNINNSEIYYKLGLALFHKGEYEKALNNFNIVISKNKNDFKPYYMISKIYLKQHNIYEALEMAKTSVKYNMFSSKSHYLIYNILKIIRIKSYKTTFNKYYQLILAVLTLPFDYDAKKIVIKSISYLRFVPDLIRAFVKINNEHYTDAIEIYRKTIEKAPRLPILYCLLGYVYKLIGRIDDAICEYKMAIWLDNLNIGAYEELCKLYEEQGDFDNAIIIYLKLIDLQPNVAEYQSNLGNILYLKGDLNGAVARYQNAITINPNPLWTSVIAQTLGYVFQDSGVNKDAAIVAYQGAYLLTPKDMDIYINLGSAFYDKGEFENALLVYKKALDLEPKNAKIHCNIAYLYWGMGNIEEAIKEYELSIKYDRSYDIAYNNLGVIYLDDLGKVKEAIDLFKKAITYNPNYALAHYNLARATNLIGDKIEAAKLYQIALDINNISNELDPQEIHDKLNELFQL